MQRARGTTVEMLCFQTDAHPVCHAADPVTYRRAVAHFCQVHASAQAAESAQPP
jgi:hypothetical protein